MDACLLYVGTEDGVFVFRWTGSEDLTQVGRGVQGNAVRGIGVHPDDPETVYIACGLRGWGLYRSQDAGESFESLGFTDKWVWDVAFDPSDPQTLYVGTEPPMLHVSHDGGRSFNAFPSIEKLPSRRHWYFFHPPFRDQPMKAGHIHGIAIHPKRPERVFAGVEQGAVIFSEDGGETWQETLVGHDVHRLAIDPADPDRIFAGTGAGLFISADAGMSWSEPVQPGYIHSIRFDPRNPRHLYVYTDGNPPLAQSKDGGYGWGAVGGGLPGAGPADSLDLHPTNSEVLFYGGDVDGGYSHLFVSYNAGGTWRRLGPRFPKIWRLRAASSDDGRLSCANRTEVRSVGMEFHRDRRELEGGRRGRL